MMTFTNWKILRRLLNSNQVSSRFLHLSLTSLTSPSLSPSPTPTPSTTQSDVFLFGVDVILTSFYGKPLRRLVLTAHRKNLFSPIPAFFLLQTQMLRLWSKRQLLQVIRAWNSPLLLTPLYLMRVKLASFASRYIYLGLQCLRIISAVALLTLGLCSGTHC